MKEIKEGTIFKPKYNKDKFETWFDYEIVEDNNIVIYLKDRITEMDMIKKTGFWEGYNVWKLSGAIFYYGQSYLMFYNKETKNKWTVSYGNSTTCTSNEVWQTRDKLIENIKIIIPNHPKLK